MSNESGSNGFNQFKKEDINKLVPPENEETSSLLQEFDQLHDQLEIFEQDEKDTLAALKRAQGHPQTGFNGETVKATIASLENQLAMIRFQKKQSEIAIENNTRQLQEAKGKIFGERARLETVLRLATEIITKEQAFDQIVAQKDQEKQRIQHLAQWDQSRKDTWLADPKENAALQDQKAQAEERTKQALADLEEKTNDKLRPLAEELNALRQKLQAKDTGGLMSAHYVEAAKKYQVETPQPIIPPVEESKLPFDTLPEVRTNTALAAPEPAVAEAPAAGVVEPTVTAEAPPAVTEPTVAADAEPTPTAAEDPFDATEEGAVTEVAGADGSLIVDAPPAAAGEPEIPTLDNDFLSIFTDEDEETVPPLASADATGTEQPPTAVEAPAPAPEPELGTEKPTPKAVYDLFQASMDQPFARHAYLLQLEGLMNEDETADSIYYYISALIEDDQQNQAAEVLRQKGTKLSTEQVEAFRLRLGTTTETPGETGAAAETANATVYEQLIRSADAAGLKQAAESGQLREYLTPDRYLNLLKAYKDALALVPKPFLYTPETVAALEQKIGASAGELPFISSNNNVQTDTLNVDNIFRYWLKPNIAGTLRSPLGQELYAQLGTEGKALADELAKETILTLGVPEPTQKPVEDTRSYKTGVRVGETLGNIRDSVRRREVTENVPPTPEPTAPAGIPQLPTGETTPPAPTAEKKKNVFSRAWDSLRGRRGAQTEAPAAEPATEAEVRSFQEERAEKHKAQYDKFRQDVEALRVNIYQSSESLQKFVNKPGNTDLLLKTYDAVIDLFKGTPGNRGIDLVRKAMPLANVEWNTLPYYDRARNEFSQVALDPGVNFINLKASLQSTLDSLSGKVSSGEMNKVNSLKQKLANATSF